MFSIDASYIFPTEIVSHHKRAYRSSSSAAQFHYHTKSLPGRNEIYRRKSAALHYFENKNKTASICRDLLGFGDFRVTAEETKSAVNCTCVCL